MEKDPSYSELRQRIQLLKQEIAGLKQSQADLRQSEERYRTVLDSIEEAYFEVDLAGNFTFFNDSLCRILGYSREELLGMNNRKYMPEQASKAIYALFNQIYRTGKPVKKAIYEIIGKDGSPRFHELSASLMTDPAGRPIGFRGISHDISDLKKVWDELRESEERYRDIFDNSADFMYTVDLKGNFTDVNQAAERLTGYAREELLQMNYRDYTPASAHQKILETFSRVFREHYRFVNGFLMD